MHVDELGGVLATFYGDPHHIGRACKSDAFNRFSVCVSDCHSFRSQDYGAIARASILVPGVPMLYQNLPSLDSATYCCRHIPPRRESTEVPVLRAIAYFRDEPPARRFVVERSVAGK